MREKIEACRGQISFLLKKDTTLSGLERKLLNDCSYQLQCMHQYLGEKGKEDSFQFAVENINRLLKSTTGVTHQKAQYIVKSIKTFMSEVNSPAKEQASPRGDKRDHASLNTTPGSSPRGKRQLSYDKASMFGQAEASSKNTNTQPTITLGQHRKK